MGRCVAVVLSVLSAGACGGGGPPAETAEKRSAPIAIEKDDRVEWVDPDSVEPHPIVHASLPPEQIARIERVHRTFAEVDPTPLDKWIEDFRRDQEPEPQIRVWEDMALAYEGFLADRELSLDAKKEVFQIVLLRSMASNEEVLEKLQLEHVTGEDALKVLELYPSDPVPITVVQQ
jgi:hypothetical protein